MTLFDYFPINFINLVVQYAEDEMLLYFDALEECPKKGDKFILPARVIWYLEYLHCWTEVLNTKRKHPKLIGTFPLEPYEMLRNMGLIPNILAYFKEQKGVKVVIKELTKIKHYDKKTQTHWYGEYGPLIYVYKPVELTRLLQRTGLSRMWLQEKFHFPEMTSPETADEFINWIYSYCASTVEMNNFISETFGYVGLPNGGEKIDDIINTELWETITKFSISDIEEESLKDFERIYTTKL